MEKKKEILFTGSDTEGGITSGYHMNDGVKVKVPYSFFGSIYDEDEEKMVLGCYETGIADNGTSGSLVPERICQSI